MWPMAVSNILPIFSAPTSSTNPDEEDIDIVGDDGNNNKNNNSGNLSSSESSRDLQLHVYGPPQFTEADVLACMSNLEETTENKDNQSQQSELVNDDSESLIKREVRSPDSPNDEELGKEDSKENQDVNESKEKVFSNQDRSKCSKCLVSDSRLNYVHDIDMSNYVCLILPFLCFFPFTEIIEKSSGQCRMLACSM